MLMLITLICILLITCLTKQILKPANFPPGPLWLPFVGNLPQLKKLSKSLGGQHLALLALAKKYNTNVLGLKLGHEYVVAVTSYPIIREVFTSGVYEGRPDNFFLRLRCMGKRNGITCTDGETWNTQRSFVNRHLRYLGFGKKPMEQMIRDETVAILSALRIHNADISVDKFLAPSVLNVLWTLVTGERISTESQLNELLDLFRLRSKAFDMTGGTLSQHPWLRYILPEWSGYNLIQKVNARMKSIFMKTIYEHQKTWKEGRDDDLIYRYISEIKTNNKNPNEFSENHLIMICLDLFVGGAQTTSGTLNFAFLMMVIYPGIQKKIQDQIDNQFEEGSPIEYSERHKVPYVEAVLLETMRFCHVIPIAGPRRVLEDTTLDGYTLPKDTTVLINLYSVHNGLEYWENPEMFMPERFLDEKSSLLKSDKLTPFGLGRRRCLGEALAKNCIYVFFTEILRRYTVSLAPGSQLPARKYIPGIILTPAPYRVKFTKR